MNTVLSSEPFPPASMVGLVHRCDRCLGSEADFLLQLEELQKSYFLTIVKMHCSSMLSYCSGVLTSVGPHSLAALRMIGHEVHVCNTERSALRNWECGLNV